MNAPRVNQMRRSSAQPSYRIAATLGITAALAGCVVGPDYQRPEAPAAAAWRHANPNSATAPALGTNWWEIYADTALNDLERKALDANQDLRQAIARVDESRAFLNAAAAGRYPQLNAGAEFERNRVSENRPLNRAIDPTRNVRVNADRFNLGLDMTYELDLWGRVRRSIESARAQLKYYDAALQTVRLTLAADVALHYFTLRLVDQESAVLQHSIDLRKNIAAATRARVNAGRATDADVSRAETQLAMAEADAIEVRRRRAVLEHALAVLCGETPSNFRVEARSGELAPPPQPPIGLPSELLLRRPDVAEAERLAAARCAEIGVAKAAFLPAITFTMSGGLESAQLSDLFRWESRAWAFGPRVSLPIFRGGRNRANLKAAESRYEQAVAEYRERVLQAFREVEDTLVSEASYSEQRDALKRAVDSARLTESFLERKLQSGLINYLELVDAERTRLDAERALVATETVRYANSIQLMKALGGGWDSTADNAK